MILSKYFDRIAIGLSTVCIVHCLAMPLLIAVLPVAAVAAGNDSHFHALMLWLVVPTSVVGLGLGYRVLRRAPSVMIGAGAIAALAAAAVWGHRAWAAPTEVAVSVVASLVLAAAHWRNFSAVRRLHRHY